MERYFIPDMCFMVHDTNCECVASLQFSRAIYPKADPRDESVFEFASGMFNGMLRQYNVYYDSIATDGDLDDGVIGISAYRAID